MLIIPDLERQVIVCEHYLNDGRQAHAVEGRDGALLAATLVEEGWLTRLDHAAYLGRELYKAQYALEHGLRYVQDAALGELESAPYGRSEGEIENEALGATAGDRCACGGGACGAERQEQADG